MDIFRDADDRRAFLYRLSEMVDRFDIECWHYCLMSNHYHLLVFSKGPDISDAFHYLNGTAAQRFNRRYQQTGHVFEARFKEQIVQEETYLRNVCRYISQNPVRANMVTIAADWEWSSHRALVGLTKEPAFLTTGRVLRAFGDDERSGRSGFASFVDSPEDDYGWYEERIRSGERCLGDRAFKTSLGIVERPDTQATIDQSLDEPSLVTPQPVA